VAWTCGRSVAQTARQVAVGVDAAVAEERPDAAEFALLHEVAVGEEDFLLLDGSAGDDFAIRVGDEALTPELVAAT